MIPEIREILNVKLIPDLVNIITDYILTPFEYHKLIDQKKYTEQEYQKYQKEYSIKISEMIYQQWKSDTEIPNDLIKNFKNLKNGKLNIKNFKSLEFASLNKHKLLF